MKPIFFINRFQIYDTINKEYFFEFLSESHKDTKIIIKLYDNFFREISQYIYEFEKSLTPEIITIFIDLDSGTPIKKQYRYDIFDENCNEKYYSGSFSFISNEYWGNINVGFIEGAKFYNEEGKSEDNNKIIETIESNKYECIFYTGNFLSTKKIYKQYIQNMNIFEIFESLKIEIKKMYCGNNEKFSNLLRSTWNFHVCNESEIYCELLENYSNINKEYIYYSKLIYEKYFCMPNNRNRNYFNYQVHIGNFNFIICDNQLANFYDKKFFSKNICNFVEKNISKTKTNIIILTRPLKYLPSFFMRTFRLTNYTHFGVSHQEDADYLLRLLFILNTNENNKINTCIVSAYKTELSWVQTHMYKNQMIDEHICCGNFDSIEMNKYKKYFLKKTFQCYSKYLKWKNYFFDNDYEITYRDYGYKNNMGEFTNFKIYNLKLDLI